jgi:hypothetical protein
MSYIGVAPQDQENFQHKVVEAQIDFSNYIYPDSKESYWATVDRYWPQIKNIVLMFTLLDEDELDRCVKERSPAIGSIFNNAWFKAPDDGRIHLIPAWHIFCDLCSESYLLYEPQN